MTTADLPSLEQIAAGPVDQPPYPTELDMALARELRALREVVQINGERTSDFREEQREDGRRIQKLEQSRRNHNKRLDSNRDLMDDVLSRLAVLEDLDWSRFVDGTGHPVDALERVQRDAEPPTTALYRNILQRAETAERELSSLRLYVKSRGHDVRSCRAVYGAKFGCTCGLAAALASATPAEGGSE